MIVSEVGCFKSNQKGICEVNLTRYTAFAPTMNPKYKPAFFIMMVFALMAPYLGFAVYFSSQYPSGQWPAWLLYTLLVWFTANFLVSVLLAKWIFIGQVVDAEKARSVVAKSVRRSTRLVIFWSLLFLYGVKETIQGKFPLNRAIPAGAFLLFFIGMFGWSIYRAKRGKA